MLLLGSLMRRRKNRVAEETIVELLTSPQEFKDHIIHDFDHSL